MFQGREVQDGDSTSYYNSAEVQEVVDRVEELYDMWPHREWGERRAEHIAVVTPYFDQVNRIRQALRKRRRDLRSVIVERIMNMQGACVIGVLYERDMSMHGGWVLVPSAS